jgi:hypothetical protein
MQSETLSLKLKHSFEDTHERREIADTNKQSSETIQSSGPRLSGETVKNLDSVLLDEAMSTTVGEPQGNMIAIKGVAASRTGSFSIIVDQGQKCKEYQPRSCQPSPRDDAQALDSFSKAFRVRFQVPRRWPQRQPKFDPFPLPLLESG